jgi:hypothetical protein
MPARSGARPVETHIVSVVYEQEQTYPGAGVIVHDAMAWREGFADVLKQTRVINRYQRSFSSNHNPTTTTIMSAAQRVQQHPIFVQAQNKAQYYNAQLDKEVSHSFSSHHQPTHFVTAHKVPRPQHSRTAHTGPKDLRCPRWPRLCCLPSHFQRPCRSHFKPRGLGSARLPLFQGHRNAIASR